MVAGTITRLLALWGVLASLALGYLVAKQDPPSSVRESPPATEPRHDEPVPGPSREMRQEASGPRPPAESSNKPELTRYGLCDATAMPRSALLSMAGHTLLSVHCGARARVLDLEGTAPIPLFDISIRPVQPGTVAQPSAMAILDVEQDGALDLLFGARFVTREGAPAGGAVYSLSHQPRGGYAAPRRLFSAHPLSLVQAANVEAPLLVLHGQDAHRGQADALWSYGEHGEPQKRVLRAAPIGAREMLAALPGTTTSGPLLLFRGQQEGISGVFVQQVSDAKDATADTESFLPVGVVNHATVGDEDADGHAEFLLAGEALFILRVEGPGTAPQVQELAHSRCPTATDGSTPACQRDPQILDVDGDGELDIKSYVHPELRIYRSEGQGHRDEPHVIKFEGDHVSLLAITLVPQPGHAPTLAALTQPAGQPETIELAILHGLRLNHESLTIAATTHEMTPGLLATHDAL